MTEKTTQSNPAFLRTEGIARRYSVSDRTVRDWQSRGILPFFKPSHKVTLFAIADCDRALQRFRVQAIGEGQA